VPVRVLARKNHSTNKTRKNKKKDRKPNKKGEKTKAGNEKALKSKKRRTSKNLKNDGLCVRPIRMWLRVLVLYLRALRVRAWSMWLGLQ